VINFWAKQTTLERESLEKVIKNKDNVVVYYSGESEG
jgi:hypothetical protein